MWNKIQRIYIGTQQVRPSRWEYSYDFKGKSTSQINADGWSLIPGNFRLQVNSNWISWSSSYDCRIAKTIPSLANAKKITISWTFITSTSTATGTSFGIGYGNGYGNGHVSGTYYGTWTSKPWVYVASRLNWADIRGTSVGNIAKSTTYKPTIIIDLGNKLATSVLSWFSNATLSLTDEQIADIKSNYTQLIPYVSVARSTISDIGIIIEY